MEGPSAEALAPVLSVGDSMVCTVTGPLFTVGRAQATASSARKVAAKGTRTHAPPLHRQSYCNNTSVCRCYAPRLRSMPCKTWNDCSSAATLCRRQDIWSILHAQGFDIKPHRVGRYLRLAFAASAADPPQRPTSPATSTPPSPLEDLVQFPVEEPRKRRRAPLTEEHKAKISAALKGRNR